MNAGKIFGGLLFGAAVGTILGILIAPEKGSETRKKLKKKGEALLNDFKRDFDNTFFNMGSKNTYSKPEEEI
jgi:gas vesicle protein